MKDSIRRYSHSAYTIYRLLPETQIGAAFALKSHDSGEILLIDGWGPLDGPRMSSDSRLNDEENQILLSGSIPYFNWIANHRQDIVGWAVTHDHRDHIQAIPSVYYHLLGHNFNPPIICSELTKQFLQREFSGSGLAKPNFIVPTGEPEQLAGTSFTLTGKKTAHSTLGPLSFAIDVPGRSGDSYIVAFLSDFKLASGPMSSDASCEFNEFVTQLQTQRVSALVTEALNCDRPGYAPSINAVIETCQRIIPQQTGRIFFTCFASDHEKIAEVAKIAQADGRNVEFDGRAMHHTETMLRNNGMLTNNPERTDILDQIKRTFTFITGNQGEPQSQAYGFAFSRSKPTGENDTFIFSCDPIPGNEANYSIVGHLIAGQGAKVIVSPNGRRVYLEWLSRQEYSADQQAASTNVCAVDTIHVTGHEHRDGLIDVIMKINPRDLMLLHHIPATKVMAANEMILEIARRSIANGSSHALLPSPFNLTINYCPKTQIFGDLDA